MDLIGHSWGAMLVTGDLGKHPEKVGHAMLVEPGFLTTEMMKQAKVRFGPRWEAGFLLRATKAWFQSLHVKGPDKDAASDYFLGQVAPYANPEYYCNGIIPDVGALHWRAGMQAMQAVLRSAKDDKNDFHIDLIKGVDRFTSPVLFLATECNRRIGKSHQEKQAKFFPNAKIEIIKGSGHSMFAERPTESLRVVREYLKSRSNEEWPLWPILLIPIVSSEACPKRLIKSWIKLESPREIPWTSLSKPLSDCTVALITTGGGIALKTDRPFDQEGERKNP